MTRRFRASLRACGAGACRLVSGTATTVRSAVWSWGNTALSRSIRPGNWRVLSTPRGAPGGAPPPNGRPAESGAGRSGAGGGAFFRGWGGGGAQGAGGGARPPSGGFGEERAATGARRGRRSTLGEFRGLLERHVLPRLGSKEIAALGLEDVEAVHRALWKTPATANRALTTLSAVLGFAERRRLRPIGSNPCKLVSRLKESPKASRFSLDELRKLGTVLQEAEAAGEITPEAALAFKLLALTGWRRSELLAHALKDRRPDGGGGLRWADIDLAARVALLRDAKSGDRYT